MLCCFFFGNPFLAKQLVGVEQLDLHLLVAGDNEVESEPQKKYKAPQALYSGAKTRLYIWGASYLGGFIFGGLYDIVFIFQISLNFVFDAEPKDSVHKYTKHQIRANE